MKRRQESPRRRSLTSRQRQILEFLRRETRRLGYPPSVREIGSAVGLSSSSSVHAQLRALEDQGYLRRHRSKSRALELVSNLPQRRSGGRAESHGHRGQGIRDIPLVGRVAAGRPLLAEENIEDSIPMSDSIAPEGSFFLRVKGESMIGAGINDGDLLLVRPQQTADNGDIVVALLNEEATVKRFYLEDGRARLQPENSHMEPIYSSEVSIIGKAVAVLRTI